jgi:hypothetical protein
MSAIRFLILSRIILPIPNKIFFVIGFPFFLCFACLFCIIIYIPLALSAAIDLIRMVLIGTEISFTLVVSASFYHASIISHSGDKQTGGVH